jgi:hypothetical protein
MSTSIDPDSFNQKFNYPHTMVQLKMIVGPGVRGIYVGRGTRSRFGLSKTGGLARYLNEKEIVLPPNTRLVVLRHSQGRPATAHHGRVDHVVEVLVLPSAK